MRTLLAAGLATLLLTGCGSSSGPSSTPGPTPRGSLPATASPSPPPPDTERIDIVKSGVGTYILVAIPVVILHNAASRTAASGVVVHFVLRRGASRVFALDSPAVMLLAGETAVIAASCTDTCNNADGIEATVSVHRWAPAGGAPIAVDPGVYSCGAGCGGHGYGTVATNLHGPQLVQNIPVNVFAACSDAAGRIVGGGQRQLTWPQNGGALAVVIPVILSSRPSICQASASPPSSTTG